MTLLEKADWQYGDREKELFESFFVRSSRGNRIACLFVRCSTNARWVNCHFNLFFSWIADRISVCLPDDYNVNKRVTHILLIRKKPNVKNDKPYKQNTARRNVRFFFRQSFTLLNTVILQVFFFNRKQKMGKWTRDSQPYHKNSSVTMFNYLLPVE